MPKQLHENHLETRRPDSQGRIVIGKQYVNETFSIEPQSNGDILLRPVIIIPKNEAWLYSNREALESLNRGLSDLSKKKLKSKGSFSSFLDDESED